MDILTFIATILGSLAWPIAIVVLALIFRRHIVTLMPLLKRIKLKDIEVEFDRQLAEVKRELGPPALPPGGGEPGRPELPAHAESTTPARYFQSLAEVSSRAAILEVWFGFELAAQAATTSLNLGPSGRPIQMPRLFQILRENDLLKDSEVDALTRLRALRNQVVHGPEPDLSPNSIADYAVTLTRITDALQQRVALRYPGAGGPHE